MEPRKVGRPRATGVSGDSRRDLLDAAAELFTTRGYAATSTRAIAQRAGLRQASLYHYFGGKDDVLAELLEATVLPSLQRAEELGALDVPPMVKLWALSEFDIALLCGGAHNLGALYLLPELNSERFARFRAERAALKVAYGELVDGPEVRVDLVFGLVEGVILTRREKAISEVADFAAAGADACVRVAGCAEDDLPEVRAAGLRLCR
ncbi:TetR/AcrR family transcriptional regulator [Lentzea tibetensis]|uniref:TetR/AcrR family transcriptional regulator n=1 Tax=Lentzea tibetensis TaxID=2591470 RepID=UPI001F3677B9|nr:TetR/AcrR family transcriptional regulator [Lentzea tibetensis]